MELHDRAVVVDGGAHHLSRHDVDEPSLKEELKRRRLLRRDESVVDLARERLELTHHLAARLRAHGLSNWSTGGVETDRRRAHPAPVGGPLVDGSLFVASPGHASPINC